MKTVDIDLLRRPRVWGSIIVVLVALAGWWFGWMNHESNKLASIHQQQATQQATVASLSLELKTLRDEAKRVRAASPFLKRFGAAIPADPDAPALVVQVYRLAQKDGVTLASITDDTLDPVGTAYSTMPVSLSVSGPHDALLQFLDGLYRLPRLLTIQSFSLTGPGNVLASGAASYSAGITATAYTTYVGGTSGSPAVAPVGVKSS